MYQVKSPKIIFNILKIWIKNISVLKKKKIFDKKSLKVNIFYLTF